MVAAAADAGVFFAKCRLTGRSEVRIYPPPERIAGRAGGESCLSYLTLYVWMEGMRGRRLALAFWAFWRLSFLRIFREAFF
ncbi:MAG: hypothetical protein ACFCVH_17625, partial [Alphaproteobacteria bacterium]